MEQKFINEHRDVVRLSEESLLVICPNPKCRREIEEPILLTIRSVKPPKEYEACPFCFAKLDQEFIKQKEATEPTTKKEEPTKPIEEITTDTSEKDKGSGPKLLKKVKSLIPSNGLSKKEKTKESKDKSADKKESGSSGCPESFGYLANRPKDVSIPQACLSCPKMVDCMLSPREE